jgi:HSP20 family protein
MFGTLMSSLDPGLFDELRRLEKQVDALFGRSAGPAGIRSVQRGTFPPINVAATPDRVDVYLFAPGLEPSALDVSVQQNLLTVAGSRRVAGKEGADYYRRERFDGEFHRAVALPEDVDPDRVEAKYRDGVLHIVVQRREAARPRQISVH